MPGTATVLGTSGESQITLVGAPCLCPVNEGEEKYRGEKKWVVERQGEEDKIRRR